MKFLKKHYAGIVLATGIVLVVLSLLVSNGRGPDAWLMEWTDWATQYVALAVSAYGVVKIVDGVAVRLTRTASNTKTS